MSATFWLLLNERKAGPCEWPGQECGEVQLWAKWLGPLPPVHAGQLQKNAGLSVSDPDSGSLGPACSASCPGGLWRSLVFWPSC